jgi:hypothetical protein
MSLLPNGNVIASVPGTTSWLQLTPTNGNYVDGTWSTIAPSNNSHNSFASQVLPDGQLFVAGGEYGTGGASAELYNPITNAWTELPAPDVGSILDAESMLLPDGNVLVAPVTPAIKGDTAIYDPSNNEWSLGPALATPDQRSTDEQSLVKLPDGSILTADADSGDTSERYIPSENKWVADAPVPIALFNSSDTETGPAVLLSNGKALFLSGTNQSELYIPSGNANPGTWTSGPTLPSGYGVEDAPAAVLPDGTVLFGAAPIGTFDPDELFIYDPATNTATQLTSGVPQYTINSASRMLMLPDGSVLINDGGTQLYTYDPQTAAVTNSAPAIQNVSQNADGTYTLTGIGLNGVSAGAAYGDDAQMDTNYPLVRLTSGGGQVYYAATSNWSNTGVQTGSATESVEFILPIQLPAGTYSLNAIANGIASPAVTLTVPQSASNNAPVFATPASAALTSENGNVDALSVLGNDNSGGTDLTYTWSTVSAPTGSAFPSFSANGTNAAQNTIAVFHAFGTYEFEATVTNPDELWTNSQVVTVTVNQATASIDISPSVASLTAGQQQPFAAVALDQFGAPLSTQPSSFTWSILYGGGTFKGAKIAPSIIYKAPAIGVRAAIQATAGLSGTATVGVVPKQWTRSTDVGAPSSTGTAYGTGSTLVVEGGGYIGNDEDRLHYVYKTLKGTHATITALVMGQNDASAAAESGLMIRPSLSPTDTMADLFVNAAGAVNMRYRTTAQTAASTFSTPVTGAPGPTWLRLTRAGDEITGYTSSNGKKWTMVMQTTIDDLGESILLGLFVSSRYDYTLDTASFGDVSISSRAS